MVVCLALVYPVNLTDRLQYNAPQSLPLSFSFSFLHSLHRFWFFWGDVVAGCGVSIVWIACVAPTRNCSCALVDFLTSRSLSCSCLCTDSAVAVAGQFDADVNSCDEDPGVPLPLVPCRVLWACTLDAAGNSYFRSSCFAHCQTTTTYAARGKEHEWTSARGLFDRAPRHQSWNTDVIASSGGQVTRRTRYGMQTRRTKLARN